MSDATLVVALQAALAGEHAALWACGRAAGELTGSQRSRALAELDAHRRARDVLRGLLVGQGAEPVAAAPAYIEPEPVTGRRAARALLAHVGDSLCAVYADLAAASSGRPRRDAVSAAGTSARRAVQWGGPARAFPGSAGQPDALATEGDQP